MSEPESPVRHLLSCMLIALHTADADTLRSERGRRKFISKWLDGARAIPAFNSLSDEVATLRQLLEQDIGKPIDRIINSLLSNSEKADHCDIFRFRSAINTLLKQGWRYATCRYPDDILHEALGCSLESKKHILQITMSESCFAPTGEMMAPLSFHIISPVSAPQEQAELAFHSQRFQVIRGREAPVIYDKRIRTIYVGVDTLREPLWDPESKALWQPEQTQLH